MNTEQNRASTIVKLSAWADQLRKLMRYAAVGAGTSDAVFNTLALELFALQAAAVPTYGRFCQKRGVAPEGISQWEEIAAIPIQAFKELDLSSLAPAEQSRVFHSSGTTGSRTSRHFHSPDSLKVYEASLLSWFKLHCLPEFERPLAPAGCRSGSADLNAIGLDGGRSRSGLSFLALVPPQEQVPHSSLVYMLETVRRTFSFSRSEFLGQLDPRGHWLVHLERVVDFLNQSVSNGEPILLLGTAFSFVHLLDHLQKTQLSFSLPHGSRVMETGGYKGRSRFLAKSELHQLLVEMLGIPPSQVISEYGMSELSSQAFDQVMGASTSTADETAGLGRSFHFPPWARVRIVSPETGSDVAEGETGLLLVCDLANVYSIATILTEDLAIRQGARFQLVGRAPVSQPRGCSLMFL